MNEPTVIHGAQPLFFEGSGGPLYANYHAPVGEPRERGFVICPPFGHEYLQFHRALRLLATLLSEAGFPVLRFDLHGCGDSAGDIRDWSLDRWFTDTSDALDELAQRTSVKDVGLIGLRLGAAIAARVAVARPDVERLVLWDPVFDGGGYLDEIRSLHDTMLNYAHVIPDAQGSRDEVLGYALPAQLVADIQGIDIVGNIQTRPAEHVLLVESHEEVSQEPLSKHLASYGCKLGTAKIPNPHLWSWVEDFGKVHVPRKVLDAIVRWAEEGAA